MNPTEETRQIIAKVKAFISKTPWKEAFETRLDVLSERASMPCELAIAGRVKAGKSSFLNALLGEKLAMVGTTETTATINYFKYGVPKDQEHPVLVVWEDGKEEWQSKAFLDSLQGNTREVIEKASKIDHLEYYVQKDILKNVTLVDTPGTNALVDEHNQRTKDFFSDSLRQKHHEQSIRLKERADAVIIVVGHVPMASNSDIIANFTDDTKAFNAMGIMTKIDNENLTIEEWKNRCLSYSNMMRQHLSIILPVSASMVTAINSLSSGNKLQYIQGVVRQVTNANDFERLFANSTKFFSQQSAYLNLFNKYGINETMRKSLMCGITDYPVFYRIARELYYNSVDEAVANIRVYSGMQDVWMVLNKQFLNRSRIIRCTSVLKAVHAMLDDIKNRCLYDLRQESVNLYAYLEIIKAYPYYAEVYARRNTSQEIAELLSNTGIPMPYIKNDVRRAFVSFVKRNICSDDECKIIQSQLESLLVEIEQLQGQFTQTDKNAEALMILESKANLFSDKEVEEIETLLGKHVGRSISDLNLSIGERILYWRGKRHFYQGNIDACQVIDTTIYNYNLLIKNEHEYN